MKWLSFEWLLGRKKQAENSPYDSMIFTGNSVIIVKGKDILTADADLLKYLTVKNLTNFEDIIAILYPPESKHVAHSIESLVEEGTEFLDVTTFENREDFNRVEKKVYFNRLPNVEIPSAILVSFAELLEKKDLVSMTALKKFTLNLMLNRDKTSRLHTLAFVKKYNVKLTTNGNVVMFRRIVKINESTSVDSEQITKHWMKIKAWKKAPKSFDLYREGDEYSTRESFKSEAINKTNLGNLDYLYTTISDREDNRYTDDYTRSYDIRLGSVYRIREEDLISNIKGSCGGTLHAASGCINGYNYNSFGDTPVAVLVNPRYIHRLDTGFSGKIGVKEMFIMGVTEQNEDGVYTNISEDTLLEFDELYNLPIFETEVYNEELTKQDLEVINEMLTSNNIEINGII